MLPSLLFYWQHSARPRLTLSILARIADGMPAYCMAMLTSGGLVLLPI